MQTSNSKPLTLAIVGIGRVAKKHAKAVKHLGDTFSIIALVNNIRENCFELNDDYDLELTSANFFDSLDAMYASGVRPDVVAICTPSGSHFEISQVALEHNSHLLVEKPLTLNLREAEELLHMAETRDLKIAVGHIYRFFPLVDMIQKEIADGKWGRILSADVTVHWGHDQAYYDQAAWRGTWAEDGGVMMNQTVHALDLMAWLLSSRPISVQGNIKQLAHKMEAEDYGTAIFTMQEGFICRVEGTTNTPEKYQLASFYISTEKGEIKLGLKKKKPFIEIINREGKNIAGKYIRQLLGSMFRSGIGKSINEFTNPHTGIYKDLASSIKENRPPRASGLDGLLSVEYVLAIYKSALENGITVVLPIPSEFTLEDMTGFFD